MHKCVRRCICNSVVLVVLVVAVVAVVYLYLSICKLENEAILRDFLNFLNLTTSKSQRFCETSTSKTQQLCKTWKLTAELTDSYQCVLRFFQSICLKYCACHEKVRPGHTKCCFSYLLSSSFSSLTLPTSAFSSVHIVGRLTSKLPSATSKLRGCIPHAKCQESTTRHQLWLVVNTKDKTMKRPTWLYRGFTSYEQTEQLRNTLLVKRISCLVSQSESWKGMRLWLYRRKILLTLKKPYVKTCLYLSPQRYYAKRIYNQEKANMVVSRL